jgi:hypothetical protein
VAPTAIFGIVFLIFKGRNLAGRAIYFDALNMDASKKYRKTHLNSCSSICEIYDYVITLSTDQLIEEVNRLQDARSMRGTCFNGWSVCLGETREY